MITGAADNSGELLTLREAAARWGVSKRTLERRLAKGELPQARMIGGEWKVPADSDLVASSTDTLADTDLAEEGGAFGGGDGASISGSVGVDGESKKAPTEDDGANGGDDEEVGGSERAMSAINDGVVGGDGTLPAVIYQKIIADKDGEIAFLRQQLHQAQQNLAREQTLRALPPPAEVHAVEQDAGGEDGGGSTTDETKKAGGQTEAGAPAKVNFWSRFWGSGKSG